MTVTSMARPTTMTERVAEEIRGLLGRRRMSQAQLARQLQQSQMWVSDRLRGVQPLDLNDVERISAVLGIQPLDLLSAAEGTTTLREGPAPFLPAQRSPSRPPNRVDATGPDRSMSSPRRASRLTRPSSRVA